MLLEDEPHGLEIELGGEVEYGKIFVIEGLDDRRLFSLAVGQIFVQFAMRFHVPVDVHAHEGGELHEARIHAAKGARMAQRHRRDQVSLEPVDRAGLGEFIDPGRVDARIDRSGHQRQAARLRRVVRIRHRRRGRERRRTGMHGLVVVEPEAGLPAVITSTT